MNEELMLIPSTDPMLREPSGEVTDAPNEVVPYLTRMRAVMKEHNGLGLSAVQVGVPFRFFISNIPGHGVLINPEIVQSFGPYVSKTEGCLSFGKRQTFVKRADTIHARWWTTRGVEKTTVLQGLAARVFQHEIDHLNGICIF